MAGLFQFASQFLVIIDFTIEHNSHIAIFRQDRLVAGTEVDNLEPGGSY
jgi:hypothetical protein